MTRQLALDMPFQPAFGRDDFFTSASNEDALAALDDTRGWLTGKMVLVGPHGSGKTHLAHVWATANAATLIAARDLSRAEIPQLAEQGAVAVEDCDQIAGDRPAEEALFHLHNLLAAQSGLLLMTATTPPRDWGLSLPDLISRAQAAPLTRLAPPDDALLAAVLVKQFADRQITISPNLVPFLINRMDRSFAAAHALVADLDAAALAKRVPVTRKLAASLLDSE